MGEREESLYGNDAVETGAEDRKGFEWWGDERADWPYAEEREESLYAEDALMALAAREEADDEDELSSGRGGGVETLGTCCFLL